ncbi:MAG: hypothetical protein U1C33_06455 [Candidatus Cloacimonadaceae bacterium]|nr:hypothetical protein [Candidatus Cloacimonadaceae bacterium]
MKLSKLIELATDNSRFRSLDEYVDFAKHYLEYIAVPENIQAKIIAQNEYNYFFLQYDRNGDYQISRAINSDLFICADEFADYIKFFNEIIVQYPNYSPDQASRACVNRMLYTMQQCLGATLDALPPGQSNKARKLNGKLFENLIMAFLKEINISAASESLAVPIIHNNKILFTMKYQHDLMIKDQKGDVKVIGAIKTTSKDRIDKVFIDKLLYSKLTTTQIYHVAIILNDVQRKKTVINNKFSVASTFLPGRFKGYMIKLCPLDGVYYLDIRKSMQTDHQLSEMIQTFDKFIFDDIPRFTTIL